MKPGRKQTVDRAAAAHGKTTAGRQVLRRESEMGGFRTLPPFRFMPCFKPQRQGGWRSGVTRELSPWDLTKGAPQASLPGVYLSCTKGVPNVVRRTRLVAAGASGDCSEVSCGHPRPSRTC